MLGYILITFGLCVIVACSIHNLYRGHIDKRDLEWGRIRQRWEETLRDAFYRVRQNERHYIQILLRSDAPHVTAAIIDHFLPDWREELPRHIRREAALLRINLQDSYEVQRIRDFLFRVLASYGSPDKKDLEEEYFERNSTCPSS